MTTLSSPGAIAGTDAPFNNRSQVARLAGIRKQMTRADFDAAVTAERTRIAGNGSGIYLSGEELQIIGEAGVREWFVATGGNDAANAAASHAKMVKLTSAIALTLSTDAAVARINSGAPGSGVGANGDIAVDWSAGVVYQKASGAWTQLMSLGNAAVDVIREAASSVWNLTRKTGTAQPTTAGTVDLVSTTRNITIAGGALEGGFFQTLLDVAATVNLPTTFTGGEVVFKGDAIDIGGRYKVQAFVEAGDLVIMSLRIKTLDLTAPLIGNGSYSGATLSFPITEPNTWTIEGLVSALTLGGASASGKTLSNVRKSGGNVLVDVSPAPIYTSTLTVAFPSGFLKDAAGNLSVSGTKTLDNQIVAPTPNAPTIALGSYTGTSQNLTITPGASDSTHGPAVTYTPKYRVKSIGGAYSSFTTASTLTPNVTGLADGIVHEFVVVANNAGGTSANSNVVETLVEEGPDSGTTAYETNFVQADGPLADGWSLYGTGESGDIGSTAHQVIGNKVVHGDADSSYYDNHQAIRPLPGGVVVPYKVEFTFKTLEEDPNVPNVGLIARYQDASNYLYHNVYSNGLTFGKRVAGGFSGAGNGNAPTNAALAQNSTHTFAIEVQADNKFVVTYDGTTAIDPDVLGGPAVEETAFSTETQVGFWIGSGNVEGLSFKITQL